MKIGCLAWRVLIATVPLALTGAAESPFPVALRAETSRLEFHSASPIAVGSVEEQTRGALRELSTRARPGTLVKLRAFAITVEDLAAVARTVKEASTPLPVLSLVQVAALPLPGQRLALESIHQAEGVHNPHGLGFLAGLASPAGERTIAGLARVAKEAGIAAADVLRVTCFYEATGQDAAARAALATTFPAADATFVQSIVGERDPVIECEGVARLAVPLDPPIQYFNFADAPASPYFSRAARVSTPGLVFTDVRLASGEGVEPARTAFAELSRASEALGARLVDVVMANHYWRNATAREAEREARREALGGTVPAASGLIIAGFADERAPMGVDLVVAAR